MNSETELKRLTNDRSNVISDREQLPKRINPRYTEKSKTQNPNTHSSKQTTHYPNLKLAKLILKNQPPQFTHQTFPPPQRKSHLQSPQTALFPTNTSLAYSLAQKQPSISSNRIEETKTNMYPLLSGCARFAFIPGGGWRAGRSWR